MFISSKKNNQVMVAVHMGSYAARGLVFEFARGSAAPTGIKKVTYKFSPSSGYLRQIAKLREAVFETVKKTEKVPEKIMVGLGPHLAEQALISREITAGAKNFSQKDIEGYFSALFKLDKKEGRAAKVFPVSMRVNGYPVPKPSAGDTAAQFPTLGKHEFPKSVGKFEFGFKALVLNMDERVHSALDDMKKSLGGMPVEFVPTLVSEVYAIRTLGDDNAVLLFIGGKETVVALVKEGKLENMAGFSFGFQLLCAKVSRELSVSLGEAEEAVRHFCSTETINGPREERIKGIFEEETAAWSKGFIEAIDCFYASGPLPSKIYMFGEGAIIPEIAAFLRDPEWIKNYSDTRTSAKVLPAGGEMLFQGDKLGGHVRGPEEFDLAALVKYALQ